MPLVNSHGDVCPSCGAEIVRGFATFEALPLVEFELHADISDSEAARLLSAEPLHIRSRCVLQIASFLPNNGHAFPRTSHLELPAVAWHAEQAEKELDAGMWLSPWPVWKAKMLELSSCAWTALT